MESEELRIGNLVYDTYLKRDKFIAGIFLSEIWLAENMDEDTDQRSYIELINPILLTEEWFLKFGFIKDGNYYKLDAFNDDLEIIISLLDVREFFTNEHLYYNYNYGIVQIKYVHQLQNLIFALTGEELKIINK